MEPEEAVSRLEAEASFPEKKGSDERRRAVDAVPAADDHAPSGGVSADYELSGHVELVLDAILALSVVVAHPNAAIDEVVIKAGVVVEDVEEGNAHHVRRAKLSKPIFVVGECQGAQDEVGFDEECILFLVDYSQTPGAEGHDGVNGTERPKATPSADRTASLGCLEGAVAETAAHEALLSRPKLGGRRPRVLGQHLDDPPLLEGNLSLSFDFFVVPQILLLEPLVKSKALCPCNVGHIGALADDCWPGPLERGAHFALLQSPRALLCACLGENGAHVLPVGVEHGARFRCGMPPGEDGPDRLRLSGLKEIKSSLFPELLDGLRHAEALERAAVNESVASQPVVRAVVGRGQRLFVGLVLRCSQIAHFASR